MTPLIKPWAGLRRWSRPLGGDGSESRHGENASHLAHEIFGNYLPAVVIKAANRTRLLAMLSVNQSSKPGIPNFKNFK